MTATMVCDGPATHDHFKKVDDRTVIRHHERQASWITRRYFYFFLRARLGRRPASRERQQRSAPTRRRNVDRIVKARPDPPVGHVDAISCRTSSDRASGTLDRLCPTARA